MTPRRACLALSAGLIVGTSGVACSLRSLAYLDSTYESADEGGAGRVDAARVDATRVDARGDAGRSDYDSGEGGRHADAGLEASVKDARRDAPFCFGSDATFCDDFDEHPFGSGWTTVHGVDSAFGIMGLWDAEAVSHPYAAKIGMLGLGDGSVTAFTGLSWSSPGTVHVVSLSSEVWIDSVPALGEYPALTVGVGKATISVNFCPGTTCSKVGGPVTGFVSEAFPLIADRDGGSTDCVDSTTVYWDPPPNPTCFVQKALDATPSLRSWSTVVVTLSVVGDAADGGTGSASVTVTVDGKQALTDGTLFAPGWLPGDGVASIGPGFFKGPAGPRTAAFDNVVINAY